MPYYKTCSNCGAHLDPGESCDCQAIMVKDDFKLIMQLTQEERHKLLDLWQKRIASRNTADQSTLQEAI